MEGEKECLMNFHPHGDKDVIRSKEIDSSDSLDEDDVINEKVGLINQVKHSYNSL